MPGPRPRSVVAAFTPYSPGLSIREIQENYGLSRVIKLASNENPLGVSASVLKAVTAAAVAAHRYPRPGSPALRRALGDRFGVGPERIVVGNGSDELIDMLIRVYVEPGRDNVLACRPCFSMYALQTLLQGGTLKQVDLETDFSFPFDKLLGEVDQDTKIVFLTTPDNPSGFAPKRAELVSFVDCLPKRALLVLDEAYMEFAEPEEAFSAADLVRDHDNVIILRTFSKLYGLAGLRLGYGAMPAEVADRLFRTKLPFSVNVLAEAAGMAVLEDEGFVSATRETVLRGRKHLSDALNGLGWRVLPSQANFVMGFPPVSARALFEELLKKGVIIRHLGSYGMPDAVRISIGTAEELDFALDAIASVQAWLKG